MKTRRTSRSIAPTDAAKGAKAEADFRAWLDASTLPHLYVEQSPVTVPEPLRGKIKRPDYLVGIPGVGLVAFDVKAKTVYDGCLIFDLDEIKKLRTFARLFHLTVYFACLNSEGAGGFWVRLDQLDDVPALMRAGRYTLSIPTCRTLPVRPSEPFYDVFVRAVALAAL